MSTGDPWSFSLRNPFSWDEDSPQGSPSPLPPSSSQKSEDDARVPPPNPFSIAKVNAAIRDANQPSRPSQVVQSSKPSILPQKGVLALVRKQAGTQGAASARGFRPSTKPARKASQTKENALDSATAGEGSRKGTQAAPAAPSRSTDAHIVTSSPTVVTSRPFPTFEPTSTQDISQRDVKVPFSRTSQGVTLSRPPIARSGTRSRVDGVFSSPPRTGLHLSYSPRRTVPAILQPISGPSPSVDATRDFDVVGRTNTASSRSSATPTNSNSTAVSALKLQTHAPDQVQPGRFISPLMPRETGAPTTFASSVQPADVDANSNELSLPVPNDDYPDRCTYPDSGTQSALLHAHLDYYSPAGVNTAVPGTNIASGLDSARRHTLFGLGEAPGRTLSPPQHPGNAAFPARKRFKPAPRVQETNARIDSGPANTHSDLGFANGHDFSGLYSHIASAPTHDYGSNSTDIYISERAAGFDQDADVFAEDTQQDPGFVHLSESRHHEALRSENPYSRLYGYEDRYYQPENTLRDDVHDTSSDLSMSSLHVVPLDALGSVQVFSYGPSDSEDLHCEKAMEQTTSLREDPLDVSEYDEYDGLAEEDTHAYRAAEKPHPPPSRCSNKRERSPSISPSPPPKRRALPPKVRSSELKELKPLSAYAHPAFANDPDASWSTLPPRGGKKSISKVKGGKFTMPLGRLLGGPSANVGKERAREVEAWKKGKEDAKVKERERLMDIEAIGPRRVTVYRPPPRK